VLSEIQLPKLHFLLVADLQCSNANLKQNIKQEMEKKIITNGQELPVASRV
jgi:hypothetical protein